MQEIRENILQKRNHFYDMQHAENDLNKKLYYIGQLNAYQEMLNHIEQPERNVSEEEC